MRSLALLTCLSSCLLFSASVVAQYPNALLTSTERMSILAERANPAVWSRLQSGITRSTIEAPSYQRNHRARYLAARTGDRVAIAQFIGEEGVEKYASTRKLKQLLGPRSGSVPIGPDSVYWDRASGKVRVLEAKGGTSPLKRTYNSLQGTNTNTVRSAGGLLGSRVASVADKLQAARVIKAAQQGNLETAVIRTQHVLGTPLAPQQVGPVSMDSVAKEAHVIQHELVNRKPELGPIFRRADIHHQASRLAYIGQALTPQVGFQRLSGAFGLPGLAVAGGGSLKGALKIGNRWIIPAGLGVAGATLATYGYQYVRGDLSRVDLFEASMDSAVFLGFTATGAAIGGFSSLGIGTMPGAVVGATLALPVQAYLWLSNNPQAGYLDPEQQEAMDRLLGEMYPVNVD